MTCCICGRPVHPDYCGRGWQGKELCVRCGEDLGGPEQPPADYVIEAMKKRRKNR